MVNHVRRYWARKPFVVSWDVFRVDQEAERMVTNIQLSVEALKDNPKFSRSLQRHEKELEHAKHIVKTIKEVGFFDGRIHNATSQKGRAVPAERHE